MGPPRNPLRSVKLCECNFSPENQVVFQSKLTALHTLPNRERKEKKIHSRTTLWAQFVTQIYTYTHTHNRDVGMCAVSLHFFRLICLFRRICVWIWTVNIYFVVDLNRTSNWVEKNELVAYIRKYICTEPSRMYNNSIIIKYIMWTICWYIRVEHVQFEAKNCEETVWYYHVNMLITSYMTWTRMWFSYIAAAIINIRHLIRNRPHKCV